MTGATTGVDSLYKARKTVVDIVTVPEFGYVRVDGRGDPYSPDFADAIQALYAVSYGAHFLIKRAQGQAPKVMPLEALWWVEDAQQQNIVAAVAMGTASMSESDRDRWRWQAMIMQPDPVDSETVAHAVEQARAKSLLALDRLRFDRWEEGQCAQTLHVGPYSAEGATIVRLHAGIAAAGYRPRGRHHEIYIGDPRRSDPAKLRTILRQPVEPL
jgi:hypothetical protein